MLLLRRLVGAGKQIVLRPAHLHFGSIPVGSVVHRTAKLLNGSPDVVRFTILRPELPLRWTLGNRHGMHITWFHSTVMQQDRQSFASILTTLSVLTDGVVMGCVVLCRVLHKPAPLPPGMEASFTVELVAEQPGDFVGEVTVKTELNVFNLSVSAKVLPAPEQGAGSGAAAPVTESSAEAAGQQVQ